AAVEAAAPAYRPQLTAVRTLEKKIRGIQAEIETIETQMRRMDEGAAREARAIRIEELTAERDALTAEIPADWEEVHKAFAALTQAEDKARIAYQRAADDAYEGPAEVLAALSGNDAFIALETPLVELGPVFATGSGDEAVDRIKGVEDMIGEVEGAGDVKSALSKARRALDKDEREEALSLYDEAMAEYQAQADWRERAAGVLPGLKAYLDAIRPNLGARVQDRLTRDQALAMAACTSHHRDVSLNF
ncbi:MAG: C4-dicarboxylate ABC transporter permease, partial [Maritimibacter sp.]|nr:C4-dicarboxylate ABC transporter permease [Maritimibacter sp.]